MNGTFALTLSLLVVAACGGGVSIPNTSDAGGGGAGGGSGGGGGPGGGGGGGGDGGGGGGGVLGSTKSDLCKPTALIVDGKDTGFDTCSSGTDVGAPLRHRRIAAACVNPSSAACTSGTCRSDADCHDGGHCSPFYGGSTCGCTYGCTTDADCVGSGYICACFDSGGSCKLATCKTDADCGSGLLCAEHEATTCNGDRGFACQTPEDECLVASDCGQGSSCNFDGKTRKCGPRPVCITP